jgi:Fe-Mn family superoxide dismutase
MYQPTNFDHLLGTPGFSDRLLKNHFTLYQGYVTNTNKLMELIPGKEPGTPEFAELKRRFGWEWNGMRLHELYFGNMKNGGVAMTDGALKQAMEKVYGSVEAWKKNFVGVGTMRGIGWVALTWDKQAGELFNVWINEHDTNHLTTATPILIMDVFEHAFMVEYDLKRADYIEAFMNAIDWSVVEKRLNS